MNEFGTQHEHLGHSSNTSLKEMSSFRLIPFARRVYRNVGKVLDKTEYARKTISKREFINDLRTAIENNNGFAAGKNGRCEQYWNYYEILLNKEKDVDAIRHYEKGLEFNFMSQTGLFPASPDFVLRFNKFYIEHIRNLDCLGICYYHKELEILRYFQVKSKLIHYIDQEPDRSSPNNDNNCYLQYFENKKILLICPFANFLKERATKEIFEGVWSKTGKRWFYPKEVDAVEFPYGFAKETQDRFSTAINLYNYIIAEIEKKDFDVALIAAAGLAIPIASHVKNMGKIGIDLGGHLQVLFGVLGKRWREREDYRTQYINEHWMDMPIKYKPKETDVCDSGAYW